MKWELEYADRAWVIDAAIARGNKPPPWAFSEPYVLQGDEFYLSAFYELSTCRDVGWGVGPIPWRDIILYAEFAELDYELLSGFVQIIRALDTVYMGWHNKKTKNAKTED